MQDTVRSGKGERVSQLLAVTLVAAGVAAALVRSPIPDTAWPLYLARQVLHGASLTGEFQEMNPPLFVWLSVPAAAVAESTGLSLWVAFVLLIGGVSLGCLALVDRILATGPLADLRRVMVPLVGFTFALFPLQEFSNREHLALILVTPYLLLAGVRGEQGAVSRALSLLIGLLGGLGFAYKPYFLPAWVGVEVYLVAKCGIRSLRRPEALSLMAAGASYALAILLLEPGYLDLVRTWVGLYGQYLRNTLPHAMFPDWWALLPMLAIGAVLAHSASTAARPVHYVLLIACLGFWLGAVLQRKGFSYHHLAGGGLGLLVLGLTGSTASVRTVRRPSDLVVWLVRIAVAAAMVWTVTVLFQEAAGRRPPTHLDPAYPRLRAAVWQMARHQPVLALSSNPAVGWPLILDADAIWASRFMSQWQLPALYHDQLWEDGGVVRPRPFGQRTGIERTFHEAIIADLEHYQPVVIIVLAVDSTVWGFGGATRIDYLDYFSSDPRFERIISQYDELPPAGRYRIFRRRAPRSAQIAPPDSSDVQCGSDKISKPHMGPAVMAPGRKG